MKKNKPFGELFIRSLKKTLLIMRIAVILMILGILQARANDAYSQKTMLSLNFSETPLVKVLDKIEDESEFFFLYNEKLLDTERKVSIDAKDQLVSVILDKLFTGTDVQYTIIDRKIILAPEYLTEVPQTQQVKIYGTIVDETGGSMPGVNILVKGTNTGAISDENGKFSLSTADQNATLVFSFIGYVTQEIAVGGKSTLNVILTPVLTGLDEVVVVGYGIKRRGEITGSIANISGETLVQAAESNLVLGLQGKMPGLVVTDRGGRPGEESLDILIRGTSTMGDNSPLIVVDGVPGRSLSNLSSNDIESISVLKDASASIYGARSANGVIVVSTKKGAMGKPKVDLNSSFGLSQFTSLPSMMSSYQLATYENEVKERYGMQKIWTEEDLELFRNGTNPITHPNTDWYDEVFDNWVPEYHANLSVSGGAEKTNYYFSGDYLNKQTMYASNDFGYKQYQIRSNINTQLFEYLNLGLNLMGRIQNNHRPTSEVFTKIQQTFPYLVGVYPNGLLGYGGEDGSQIMATSEQGGWNDIKDIILNSSLTFDLKMDWLTKGLQLSGTANFDFNVRNSEIFRNVWTEYKYNEITGEYDAMIRSDNRSRSYTDMDLSNGVTQYQLYNIKLSYDRTFGNHKISGFLGYEQEENFYKYMYGYRRNLISSNKVQMWASSEDYDSNTGNSSESGRLSYFGSLSYNFMSKYLVDFTLRRDGSSNFPEGKRFGLFPAASFGWRISDESFMSAAKSWLSNLLLRASWSQMGNDRVAGFQYITQYAYGGNFQYAGMTSSEGNYYVIGNNKIDGFAVTNTGNPNITWEVGTTTNIGVDAMLWDGDLTMNLDYFYQKRRKILIQRNESVPYYSGLELPDENLGKVDNKGVEFGINYKNKIGNSFTYNVGGQITYNHNEIVFMDEAKDVPEWRKQEGFPIQSFVVYETDGIFETQKEVDNTTAKLAGTLPGDIKYVDVDGDGEITANDQVRVHESTIPEFQFGFNTGIGYKGLSLNVFFQGQTRATAQILRFDWGDQYEYLFTERWTPDNPDATMPRASDRSDFFNSKPSTHWLFDASFLRLKTIELSYQLQPKRLWNLNFETMRFFIQGHNLFSIDKMPNNIDPEVASTTAQYYPQLRSFTAGINLSFR